MRIIDWLWMVAGAVAPAWRMPRSVSVGMLSGLPPVDYTVKTQADLLASFSDAVGRNGITPKSMRDFVASTITTQPGGNVASIPLPLPGWTTATRPTGLVGPAIGYNYDLKQLDMWDDHIQAWVNPSFQGGAVAGDTTFTGNVVISGEGLVVTGGVYLQGTILAPNMPTSVAGEPTGTMWNNGLIVNLAP